MALHSIEVKTLGMKKEAVRGIAEAAPDKWRAITGDSELTYVRSLIEDEAKRGVNAKFPSFAGRKDGTGTLTLPVMRVSEIGEFLQMLHGDPVSVQQGATTAYKHTFSPNLATALELPTYTMFMNRGVSIKSYNLGSMSAMTFAGDQEGPITVELEAMFKSEAGGAIGSPDFSGESVPMTFAKSAFTIGGGANNVVREFSLKLENGLFPLKTLDQTEDVRDLLAKGPFLATGSFTVYFEDETERAKFIAATDSSFNWKATGPIIASTFEQELEIDLPLIQYTAYPYEDQDGLFGASVTFEAKYSTGSSKLVSTDLTNEAVSY